MHGSSSSASAGISESLSKARNSNSSSTGDWSEGGDEDEIDETGGLTGGLALQRPPKPLRPAGVPAFKETAAAQLRAQATKQALLEGKFDSREER